MKPTHLFILECLEFCAKNNLVKKHPKTIYSEKYIFGKEIIDKNVYSKITGEKWGDIDDLIEFMKLNSKSRIFMYSEVRSLVAKFLLHCDDARFGFMEIEIEPY
jgi:hypothetical protein